MFGSIQFLQNVSFLVLINPSINMCCFNWVPHNSKGIPVYLAYVFSRRLPLLIRAAAGFALSKSKNLEPDLLFLVTCLEINDWSLFPESGIWNWNYRQAKDAASYCSLYIQIQSF